MVLEPILLCMQKTRVLSLLTVLLLAMACENKSPDQPQPFGQADSSHKSSQCPFLEGGYKPLPQGESKSITLKRDANNAIRLDDTGMAFLINGQPQFYPGSDGDMTYVASCRPGYSLFIQIYKNREPYLTIEYKKPDPAKNSFVFEVLNPDGSAEVQKTTFVGASIAPTIPAKGSP